MSAYITSKYSQSVLGKWKPFLLAAWRRKVRGPCPGWIGDEDKRPLRFKKWIKRSQSARDLFYKVRRRGLLVKQNDIIWYKDISKV